MVEIDPAMAAEDAPSKLDYNYKIVMDAIMLEASFPFKSIKLMSEIGGYNLYEIYLEAMIAKRKGHEAPLLDFKKLCFGIFKKLIDKSLIDPKSRLGKR